MRIAIVQFPGSNCERETILAVKRANMQPVEFLWNQSKEALAQFDGYIIVGGFSYEDRSRSGIIAALDPIMQVIREQSDLGKPVLGICNGAQILVETGLVPGLKNHKVGMALIENKRMQQGKVLGTGFYNAWVNVRVSNEHKTNAFTRHLTNENKLRIPVAHGEGRFVIPEDLLVEMQLHGLNTFQYCDSDGNIDAHFPVNPNGSINNIAAVSNLAGNVMAMMPHPERTENGDAIFASMRDYIASKNLSQPTALQYEAPQKNISQFTIEKSSHELLVDLIITDNAAVSVENELNNLGIPVRVSRKIHWELVCDSKDTVEKIMQSGVLFNSRKEGLATSEKIKKSSAISFLIRAKDELHGLQKKTNARKPLWHSRYSFHSTRCFMECFC